MSAPEDHYHLVGSTLDDFTRTLRTSGLLPEDSDDEEDDLAATRRALLVAVSPIKAGHEAQERHERNAASQRQSRSRASWREKLVHELDPVQRHAWSPAAIGGTRAATAADKKRARMAGLRRRLRPDAGKGTGLRDAMLRSAAAEKQALARATMDILDGWVTDRRMKVADLFRSRAINTSGDDALDAHEIHGALGAAAGLDVTRPQIEALIDHVDADGNRELDVGEFDNALRAHRQRCAIEASKPRDRRAEAAAAAAARAARPRSPPPLLAAALWLPAPLDRELLAVPTQRRARLADILSVGAALGCYVAQDQRWTPYISADALDTLRGALWREEPPSAVLAPPSPAGRRRRPEPLLIVDGDWGGEGEEW